jgi:hypothetical protein
MIRWIVTPLTLAFLGLVIGLLVLAVVMHLDVYGHARNWNILVPLATCAAIGTYFLTLRLLRFERRTPVVLRDHPRQMWLLYPLWLLTSGGLAGSHVAILYLYPFAALTGVMVGNFIAIVRTLRAAV